MVLLHRGRRFGLAALTTAVAALALPVGAAQAWSPTCQDGNVTLQSSFSNKYVAAELDFGGSLEGMLTASRASAGTWEQFRMECIDNSHYFALKNLRNKRYVAMERNYTGRNEAMLRARSTTLDRTQYSWEIFRIMDGATGISAYWDFDVQGALVSRRNGLIVTAEFGYAQPYKGMLRASSSTWGDDEWFRVKRSF
jgi:hypothetical protein